MRAGRPLAGARVLVVEDSDDSREMLCEFMRMFDIEVEEARSGSEAIAKFRANPPSLVVSDISMPDGDGLALVQAIRELPAEQGGLTPAIAVSASPGAEAAILAGFHAYLEKPVDPVELLEVMRNFLEPVLFERPSRGTCHMREPRPDLLVLTFIGHVSVAVSLRCMEMVVPRLECGSVDVVVDLRGVQSFDPSAAYRGQRATWKLRRRIRSIVLVGAPAAARVVTFAASHLVGIPTRHADEMPAL